MRTIFPLLLLILSGPLFSQKDTLLAEKGDLGVSIILTDLKDNINLNPGNDVNGNYGINLKYFLSRKMALRGGISIHQQKNSLLTQSEPSFTTLLTSDSVFKSTDISVSIGVERHLDGSNRLDPFIGASLGFGFLGKDNYESTTELYYTDLDAMDQTKRITEIDGGINVKLNLFTGFNFFVGKRLSFGTELGISGGYSKVGGAFSTSTVVNNVNGSTSSSLVRGKLEQTDNSIRVSPSALINFTFFFGI